VQEMMLYSPRAALQLKELLQKSVPDLLLVDTIRMAQYVEAALPGLAHSVLYLDDLYSLRYKRMLDAMRSHPEVEMDSVGSFGRFLPGFAKRFARGSLAQKCLLDFESELVAKRERNLSRQFDDVMLLNGEEAAHLTRHAGTKNIRTVKPLLGNHRHRLQRCFAGKPVYLFLGNLQYPANAYSLSLFLRDAMPGLVHAEPRTQLIVLGRGVTDALKEQARCWNGHIRFLDFIEDLAPLMATAAAMVVPMIYASGLRMKALDALYYGLPVVSTPVGIEGIPTTPGRECFIEDDIAAFVEPLTQLLDPALNRSVSHEAQRLYTEEFAPEVVWNEYQTIFGTATGETLTRAPQ